MKMSIGKRLVLLLHWLLSVIACLMCVFFCIWPEVIRGGIELLCELIGKRSTDIMGGIFLAIYVILAAASIAFIVCKNQRDKESGFITVISDDSGKTRIAVGAIEQMIRIAVHGVEGIAELKTTITNEMDAIAIAANITVISGVHIPTVTSNVQRTIRNYIELNCGVAVREVSVSVHALETPEENGKRGRKWFGKGTTSPLPAAIVEAPLCEDKSAADMPCDTEASVEPIEEASEATEIEAEHVEEA